MQLQQSIKMFIEKVAQLQELCQYAARLMFCSVCKNIWLTKTGSHCRNWDPCTVVYLIIMCSGL